MIKKIALSLVAIGLVSSLVGMASFALFSATATNANNTFTAGTVAMGAPSLTTPPIPLLAPGDSENVTYTIQYTGNLEAFVGVKGDLSGDLAGGATPLTATMSVPTSTLDPVTHMQVVHCHPGDTVTATITYALPLAADNSYQGKTGTYTVSAQAVQVAHNNTGNPNLPDAWN